MKKGGIVNQQKKSVSRSNSSRFFNPKASENSFFSNSDEAESPFFTQDNLIQKRGKARSRPKGQITTSKRGGSPLRHSNQLMRKPQPGGVGQDSKDNKQSVPDYQVIGFDSESSKFNEVQRKEIKRIASSIFMNPRQKGEKIEIVGHADKPGPIDYNKNLGLERAKMARGELELALKEIYKNIDPTFIPDISISSVGEPKDGPEIHDPKLRKVSIFIKSSKSSEDSNLTAEEDQSTAPPTDEQAGESSDQASSATDSKEEDQSTIHPTDEQIEKSLDQSSSATDSEKTDQETDKISGILDDLSLRIDAKAGMLSKEDTELLQWEILTAVEKVLLISQNKKHKGLIHVGVNFKDAAIPISRDPKLLKANETSYKFEAKYKGNIIANGKGSVILSGFFKQATGSETKKKDDETLETKDVNKMEAGVKAAVKFALDDFEIKLYGTALGRQKSGDRKLGLGGGGSFEYSISERWKAGVNVDYLRLPGAEEKKKNEFTGLVGVSFTFGSKKKDKH